MALRKCACIDTLYTELDWLDRFQAAKNDGFEAVEFWDWRIRDLDATREAAEKAGIAISGFNGDADYSLVDPTHKQKYLDYLKQSIAAAKKVGAASVTIQQTERFISFLSPAPKLRLTLRARPLLSPKAKFVMRL